MTGPRRRQQLLDVGRMLFAERGFDPASVDEIANRAGVSKPNSTPTDFSSWSRVRGRFVEQHAYETARSRADRVAEILERGFAAPGFDDALTPMHAHLLVGMVAFTGQWWLEVRTPAPDDVVAHVVNMAWNGLPHLDPQPIKGISI